MHMLPPYKGRRLDGHTRDLGITPLFWAPKQRLSLSLFVARAFCRHRSSWRVHNTATALLWRKRSWVRPRCSEMGPKCQTTLRTHRERRAVKTGRDVMSNTAFRQSLAGVSLLINRTRGQWGEPYGVTVHRKRGVLINHSFKRNWWGSNQGVCLVALVGHGLGARGIMGMAGSRDD
jgi:hypothetical protein